MRFDRFVIAFVVFSLFIVSGTFIIGNVNTNYNANISTSEFNATYNTIDDMYAISKGMKNETLDAELSGSDETWNSMTKGAFSAFRLVRDTFKLVGQIVEQLANTLHVPDFMIIFAMTGLLLSLITGLIFLIMRFKG